MEKDDWFTEEVGKVLIQATDDLGGDPCDVLLLVPRVIAAIDAASRAGGPRISAYQVVGYPSGLEYPAHDAALRALKGEKP